jgi:uncharacterized protein
VDVEPISLACLSRLPVLPLPGTVLFPGTVLPLQLVEPGYREMIADAMESDQTIAATMLKADRQGAGDGDATTLEVHDVGCVGRVIHAERLADGRYNVLLHGVHRVRLLEELAAERSYRLFRAEVIPRPVEKVLTSLSHELGQLESCVLSLGSTLRDYDAQMFEVLRSTPDPVQLVDILCAAMVPDSVRQQRLLATVDFGERLATVIDILMDLMLQNSAAVQTTRAN